MFIINLTYKVPIAVVDTHLDAHKDYVREQYELGNFVASGRKVPRTGGIIFSKLADPAQVKAVVEKDPFKIHELAEYEIIEFAPSRTVDELAFLMQ